MKKRAEITPLPWSIGDDSPTSVCAKPSWTERMVPLALVYDVNDHQRQTPVSVANAAYIVRACNAYPKLVEALRECMKDTFTAAKGMSESGKVSPAGLRYVKAVNALNDADGE